MTRTSRTPASTPTPPPGSADLIGTTFGDFRIVRKLGQGGMGRVYLAEQISLKRKVAVKVLHEDLAANATALERFESESKTVARLSHPNVVQVYLVGQHEGRSFMVLEYVEGKSLAEYLARQGRLDVPLTFSLMRQVGNALSCASELGIVHRDVKPANILLTRKGHAKVADFGLSRCLHDEGVDLTRDGTTVGTPLYMSPEQLEGKPVDFRSDVYSFGVTCYHALTGRPPFEGSNALEVALKHVREEPAPLEGLRPDLPPALCEIVAKMMAKKRRDRYQTARELLDDVARARASLGGTSGYVPLAGGATETIAEDEAPAPPWKKPAVLVGVGAAALLLLGLIAASVIGVAVWRSRSAPPAAAAPARPAPDAAPAVKPPADREATLRAEVERSLAAAAPDSAGVDDCIELGVLYLDRNQTSQAKALFERMEKQRAPSPYHFVGMLGVAVTDSIQKHYRASRARFTALFDGKVRDDRVRILADHLAKHPGFAKWVEQAEASNEKYAPPEPSLPPKKGRFTGKFPFKKP